VSFPTRALGQLFGRLNQVRVALHAQLRGFENLSAHQRPKRMLRNGRPVDSNFRFFDCLYRRCGKEDVSGDRLLPLRISCTNPSVGWSKYGRPWDVIFDFPGQGIAQLLVCALPKELPVEKPAGRQPNPPKLHSFFPAHVPECENYPHCEIWTFKEGVHIPDPKLPPMVKKEFRQIMSDRSLILHNPSV